jgi:hypothetical protein
VLAGKEINSEGLVNNVDRVGTRNIFVIASAGFVTLKRKLLSLPHLRFEVRQKAWLPRLRQAQP